MYIVTIVAVRKKKALQITTEEKKSEQEKEKERRGMYSTKYLIISMVSFLLLVGLVLLGVFFIPIPSCGEGQVLQYGICQYCYDYNCYECSTPEVCTTCYDGYFIEND